MKPNRWAPLARFPITGLLQKQIPNPLKRKRLQKPEIVSESLCDDILQRLGPYLLRKPPVDVLDLRPGAGLWSSKVNDFLRPRRHVLVEPNIKVFGPMLKTLAESKPCYSLVSQDIHDLDEDWHGFLAKHLPEQGFSNCDASGALAKNDALLVLANVPPNASKLDHYTPARSWSALMEACMRQSGLHTYGSVRVIATLPLFETQTILPRSVSHRNRPALVTENVALHAFEVASTQDQSTWTMAKGWDLAAANAARVAERSAQRNIVVPAGRQVPPIPLAPEASEPGQSPYPYVPRIKTDMHDRILKTIKTAEESPSDTALKKKKQRALIQLRYDNRNSFLRKELADKQIKIDGLHRSLSRKAADQAADLQGLQPILDQISSLKADIAKLSSEVHFEVLHHVPNMIDDARSALSTGTFDDAVLLWDRRPFEPLHIQPEELYPRETDMTMIYFEADANSPITRLSNQVDEASRANLYRIYEAVSLIFGSRGAMPVSELLNSLFPSRPINDLVRAIPSLATHAARTPKPNFDSLPKTVHGRPGEDPSKPLDPVSNFQENLDYDLTDVRIRCLSPITLWEIIMEYQKDSNTEVNVVQLNRLLGGTLTSFRAGEYSVEPKKLR
ncbi:uncharacterized protein P174DRAFT_410787 [Aspergillus novofumigatus IBT 16806]|uniref:rRNA adenine N(6)-methyltransferase n=1 Tax=Aspergillus novofumigatus (strain IBT 16806) TaxID=1392255 RepID=A0A2I1C2N2_ASPN1|nr:uncharacterized protein P174DRAFT_410787 [Aspergillus novofumigatus IBT 16806]PKX91907.1 hypothetical protein P174DRAFT_410787 [Aspergillus novofumigatus IBT 16806]